MSLEKIIKKLPTGFQEEADGMNEEQLREIIISSENNITTAQRELQENEKYLELKAAYKEVQLPTKEALAAQRAKISYALHLLEEKGLL